MTWWQRLRRRRQLEHQLDAELRDHLERLTAHHVASGLSASEARRRARLEFGGLEQVKETCRDVRNLGLVEDAVQDARYAWRTFRANPGFTAVAILTLALGIGANVAMFSLLNGLLFRSLPVQRPERLVLVANCTGNLPVIEQLRQQRALFSDAAGWTTTQFTLGGGGEAEWVDGLWITDRYFETLGVTAAAGTTRLLAEPASGVVISDAFWRRHFDGEPGVLGQTLVISRVPFTIAGIAPARFTGIDVGRTFDVALPIGAYPRVTARRLDGCGPLNVVARLADGQTMEGAAAGLLRAQDAMRARLLPGDASRDARARFLARPFSVDAASNGSSTLRPRYEQPLLAIMAVAGLVLLIACATLATLLLARGATRTREISVRLALGASRRRLVRQMLLESLVLAAMGAATGWLVAWAGSRLIVRELAAEGTLATGRIIFGSAQLFLDVSPDWHVLAFATAVTAGATVLFGLLPAVRLSRVPPMRGLEAAPRADTSTSRTTPFGGLVIAQVALSLMLVVAAALFVRSLSSLVAVPLGFEPDRMLVVDITTPQSPAASNRRLPVFQRARDAVRQLPGVADATLSVSAPMTGWDLLVEVETGAAGTGSDSLANIVSPGWFQALGTPLVAGRDFRAHDRADSAPVVMVNEAFVRQFLRGGHPLGRTITVRGMGSERTPRQIIGIAADAIWSLRDPVPPILYVPLAQADAESLEARLAEEGLTLGIRADDAEPGALAPRVADAISGIDPALTLTFRSPAEHLTASLTQERVLAILSGFFGLLALGLAALGLYGVSACAVSRRRTEIGIRLALGGTPGGVARLVLGHVSRRVAAGVAIGVAASLWLSPFVSTLLYGIAPRDALSLIAAAAVLCTVAALAGWLPAYRASRRPPIAALRFE